MPPVAFAILALAGLITFACLVALDDRARRRKPCRDCEGDVADALAALARIRERHEERT